MSRPRLRQLAPFAVTTWAAALTLQAPVLVLSHLRLHGSVAAYVLIDRPLSVVGILTATVQTVLLARASHGAVPTVSRRFVIAALPAIALIAGATGGALHVTLRTLGLAGYTQATPLLAACLCGAYLASAAVIVPASRLLVLGGVRRQMLAALGQAAAVVAGTAVTASHGPGAVALVVFAARIGYLIAITAAVPAEAPPLTAAAPSTTLVPVVRKELAHAGAADRPAA